MSAEEIQVALEDLPQTTLPLARQVAVLHARMAGLLEPVVAVITTEAPLPVGDVTADLFFVLLAPIDEPQRHLHALARVSEICCADTDVVSPPRAATTASELVQAIGNLSPDAPLRPIDEGGSSVVVVLELEDDRSAKAMADVVNIAFRRPVHLTRQEGSLFELFRSAARANPIHHLVVFNVGQADLGVLRALLDQQATLAPGTLCKLCLLEGS